MEEYKSVKVKRSTLKKLLSVKIHLENKHNVFSIPRTTIIDYCVNNFIARLKEEDNNEAKKED